MDETEKTKKENKSKTIQIRVSPTEYAILEKAAKAHYLDIGPYVRSEMLLLIARENVLAEQPLYT